MQIDTRHFPLVWMSSSQPSNWESKLDALLSEGEKFVLLTREMPGRGHDANGEDRKQFALWLKRNRELLKRTCAGSVVIVPNQAIAMSLSVVATPLSKAFGYPVRVATEDRLETEINSLLGKTCSK
ncbi:hypothetical protein [Comamonas composti]|uniref:hypothetical protein n=1 Tax=Comamonas composti TaxID=408558 RepID=UPI0012EB3FEC|nr:hypothetical protein [Comamonas composti]